MKHRIRHAFAAFLICFVVSVGLGGFNHYYALTSGDWEYELYKEYGDTGTSTVAELTGFTGTATSVTVPATIGGYKVKRLRGTFFSNDTITAATIPNGITELIYTFAFCDQLKRVNLPSSISSYEGAFETSGLEEITLPKGRYSLDNTFTGCKSLKKAIISGAVTNLSNTFSGCTNLTEITISGVSGTGDDGVGCYYTFSECGKLQSVSIPKGVEYIWKTFDKCTKLETIYLPESISSVSEAFAYCYKIKDIYYAGSKCEWIGATKNYEKVDGDKLSQATVHYAKADKHDFSTYWDTIIEPTCTKAGKEERTCERCGAKETRSVSKLGHAFDDWYIVEEYCDKEGVEERYCWRCDKKETRKLAPKGHTYTNWYTTVAPTYTEEGIKVSYCDRCGKEKQDIIKRLLPENGKLFKVKIKKKTFVYNRKAQKPKITGVYVNGKKISKKYYTVSYTNNKNVGNGAVIVKGKGKYAGYIGAADFTINMKRGAISKVKSPKKGQLKVTWKKDPQAQGYELQYSMNKSFKSGVMSGVLGKKTSEVISGLTSKKYCYVRIRAYRNVNGVLWYSPWSAAKKAKIK